MNKSYAQITAEIAKLEKQAAALRATETTKVVAQLRETIATFGLSVEQLFGQGAKALKAAAGKVVGSNVKATRKGAGVAKYRDPKTGKTWTGFGKPPGWIATARTRERFLIDQTSAAAKPLAREAAALAAKEATRSARASAAPAKKASRIPKVGAGASKVTAPEVVKQPTAKKVAAKNAAVNKSVSPQRSGPVAKTGPAPKVIKGGSRAASKVATKMAKPKAASKESARTKTAVAAAVSSAPLSAVDTTAAAS